MLFVLAKFTTCRDFLEKKIGQFKTKFLTKKKFGKNLQIEINP
jgi:hypothetical protein